MFLIYFISRSNHCYWERRFANIWSQIKQIFHQLEDVGLGSETQLQVNGTSGYLI